MIKRSFRTDNRLMTIVHFNRIAMARGQQEVWTVHNSLGCFAVKNVHVNTPMYTVFDPAGKQPRAKFKGAAVLQIANGTAILS